MGVHVVGNVCLDTTYRVGRFPLPGETLAAQASWTGIGGKGANQALAAVRAGAQVSLHAAIGDDAGAVRLRSELGRERLGLDLVVHRGPSDTSVILLCEDGENLIVSETSRALAFDPMAAACAFASALRAGDIVLLQGNLSQSATTAAIELARRRGARTILNPSPLAGNFSAPWPAIDTVVANLGEVRTLTGEAEPEPGAAALRARGAAVVAVTLGAGGVLLAGPEGMQHIPAPRIEPVDTSGAGDVLCGVFAGLIAQGQPVVAALVQATAAASLSATRRGTFGACPSAEEIAALAPAAAQGALA